MAEGGASVDTLHSSERRVRTLTLSYHHEDSRASALRLILAAQPQWEDDEEYIELERCTDGMTNTLLKVVNRKPTLSKQDADNQAVLLRAYGRGTDVIIDRQRETESHELLMKHGLAPELLARFENGTIYRFVRGSVATAADLARRPISMAIARRMAQWHSTMPCKYSEDNVSKLSRATSEQRPEDDISYVATAIPSPNLWTVMQKWILALPMSTQAQRNRQELLQQEFTKVVAELSQRPGLGAHGLVFAHCDLLCANIIVLPTGAEDKTDTEVAFIDFEYATPSPAAFDIANHFSEWGGQECDYNSMPTRAERREFIDEYLTTYRALSGNGAGSDAGADADSWDTESLLEEVDLFRGMPGLFWGTWASIQAVISEIDIDYASYAETRLQEYWAWQAAGNGELAGCSADMQLREKRWAKAE